MTIDQVKKLNIPKKPGVYVFRDAKKRPLYIGRATELKSRIISYFRSDVIVSRGPRIVDMIHKAKSVTWTELQTVLESVFLEAEQIKKYQPYYNVMDRDDKSMQYVVVTKEDWPRLFIVRERDYLKNTAHKTLPYKVWFKFGPFSNSKLIKDALKIIRKILPFRDLKSTDIRHEAFYRSIGQSPENISANAKESYISNVKYIVMLLQGKRKLLYKQLNNKMKMYAKFLEFEKANNIKKLIKAIDHINDVSLIGNQDYVASSGLTIFRIEAYDIAHMSGTNAVGVMVVNTNGQNTNDHYRKFKMSKDSNNDTANLKETLERRLNHPEWTYPNLIVVDGNMIQQTVAEEVLSARRINIPVVSVTKDDRHKAARINGNPEIIKLHEKSILKANFEAHRFAIRYHRNIRDDI